MNLAENRSERSHAHGRRHHPPSSQLGCDNGTSSVPDHRRPPAGIGITYLPTIWQTSHFWKGIDAMASQPADSGGLRGHGRRLYCRDCGAALPSIGSFCPSCGTVIPPPAQSQSSSDPPPPLSPTPPPHDLGSSKPAVGREPLQFLSPARLSAVFKKLYEGGGAKGNPLSPRTVEFARAVLRRAMQDAVMDRLIDANPVVGTKRPRVGKPGHATWTGGQLQAYLSHVGETRWSPLWNLGAATGMRRGELMALRWEDVDLDAGMVHVEHSVTYQGRKRTTATPKNHERRDVAIDPHTVTALRAWRTRQAGERLAWGEAYRDVEGLLFTWEHGTPVHPDYASKTFIKSQKGSELPRLTLHELRHSHATILLRAGVPVHVVAKRLGHKDPSLTLNVYAHAIPDDDGGALDVYSRSVFG